MRPSAGSVQWPRRVRARVLICVPCPSRTRDSLGVSLAGLELLGEGDMNLGLAFVIPGFAYFSNHKIKWRAAFDPKQREKLEMRRGPSNVRRDLQGRAAFDQSPDMRLVQGHAVNVGLEDPALALFNVDLFEIVSDSADRGLL